MYKIVFDSDGLIKLTKTGLMENITSNFQCMITEEVYRESVVMGIGRLYEDAFIIEEFVNKGKIKNFKTGKFERRGDLSNGELSTLQLFREKRADAIVSDDRKFLSLLESEGVPFIVPAHVIVIMAITNKINRQEALEALKKIKSIIKPKAYEEALNIIGGEI